MEVIDLRCDNALGPWITGVLKFHDGRSSGIVRHPQFGDNAVAPVKLMFIPINTRVCTCITLTVILEAEGGSPRKTIASRGDTIVAFVVCACLESGRTGRNDGMDCLQGSVAKSEASRRTLHSWSTIVGETNSHRYSGISRLYHEC